MKTPIALEEWLNKSEYIFVNFLHQTISLNCALSTAKCFSAEVSHLSSSRSVRITELNSAIFYLSSPENVGYTIQIFCHLLRRGIRPWERPTSRTLVNHKWRYNSMHYFLQTAFESPSGALFRFQSCPTSQNVYKRVWYHFANPLGKKTLGNRNLALKFLAWKFLAWKSDTWKLRHLEIRRLDISDLEIGHLEIALNL